MDGIPRKRDLLNHLLSCRISEFPVRAELMLAVGNGESMPVEIHSHRRPGDQGTILTTLMDLTDRRQAERERQRAAMAQAASEAKGRVIATVSHELRTSLALIANLLAVLKLTDDIPPSRRPVLAIMERNLWHEVRLVDELLEESRISNTRSRAICRTSTSTPCCARS